MCPRAASGMQTGEGKIIQALGKHLLLPPAGKQCRSGRAGMWALCAEAVVAEVLAGTGTGTLPGLRSCGLPGCPVPWGTWAVPTQGHLEYTLLQGAGSRREGSPGNGCSWQPCVQGRRCWEVGPLSLVSHGRSLCSPHLWDVLLGASTAHLCCTRLRAATSLKGDVSFPALDVLPPYPKPPLLSLGSHRVSAVCGNWENPQSQHGCRAPRGHQSAGKALAPFLPSL